MNKQVSSELFNNLPDKIIATIHKDPDFDAVGSLLALNDAMNSLGKSITLLSPDINKQQFKLLPGIDDIQTTTNETNFDLAIYLDCSDKSRIAQYNKFPRADKVINIDHHQDNTHFGDINIVKNISSVGELLYGLFNEHQIELTTDIATNLYAAIIFDTGSFQFSNTTPETFKAASTLINLGVNVSKISEFIFEQKDKNYFEDIKIGLNNLYVDKEHPFLIVSIPHHENFSKTSTINFFRQYKNIELVIVSKEVKPGEHKLSFRSKQSIDVTNIAKQFNGGGHKKAAGGFIKKPLDIVKKELINACIKAFK